MPYGPTAVQLSVLEIDGSRIMKLEVEFGVDDERRPTSQQLRRVAA